MKSFTVLMPTYDRPDLCAMFDRAIDSCLDNTLVPDEIIVVVDGPVNAEFGAKIKRYELRSDITVLWLPHNVGLTAALNEGLRLVTTKYVFRADGDDVNRPYRFALQMEMLTSGLQLVGGAIEERDLTGKRLAVRRCPACHDDIVRFGRRRNPFNHMTVAFEYKAVMSVGGYPDVYLLEDWALWTLMLKNGVTSANTEEILVDATADIDMYKRRGGWKMVRSEFTMQKFLIKHADKRLIFAFFDFILKGLVLVAPPSFRGFIYKKYLRDS